MSKKIGLLMLTVLGVLVLATGCGAEKISLNDFATCEFIGYDGYGGAEISFDYEELQNQVVLLADEKKNLDDEDVKKLVETLKDAGAFEGEWSNSETIKNGDTVSYKWAIPDKTIDKFKDRTGIQLVADDLKVQAEGLKDPSDFNIIDYLTINVEGVAPNGTLHVSKSEELKKWPKFKFSKIEGLDNDETITMTVGKTTEAFEKFRKLNHLPEFDQEISYTVSGIPNYITNMDQISDELLEYLKSDSYEWIINHKSKSVVLVNADSLTLVGMGFCNTNDESANMVIMIYEACESRPSLSGSYYEDIHYVPVVYNSVTDSNEVAHEVGQNSDYFVLIPTFIDSSESIKKYYSENRYENYDELQIKELN